MPGALAARWLGRSLGVEPMPATAGPVSSSPPSVPQARPWRRGWTLRLRGDEPATTVSAPAAGPVAASGSVGLDALLPGGGWPCRTLTELLPAQDSAVAMLRLLAPVLAATLQAGRLVMLFDPPAGLSAGLLDQLGLDVRQMLVVDGRTALSPGASSLWVVEQALASGTVGAVVAWLPADTPPGRLADLRRAAVRHDGPAFLVRHAAVAAHEPGSVTTGSLRIAVQDAGADRLLLRLLNEDDGRLRGALRRLDLAPLPASGTARCAASPGTGVPRQGRPADRRAAPGGCSASLQGVGAAPGLSARACACAASAASADGGIVVGTDAVLPGSVRAGSSGAPASGERSFAFDAVVHRPLHAAVFVDLGG